jgi:hypothetical protein
MASQIAKDDAFSYLECGELQRLIGCRALDREVLDALEIVDVVNDPLDVAVEFCTTHMMTRRDTTRHDTTRYDATR